MGLCNLLHFLITSHDAWQIMAEFLETLAQARTFLSSVAEQYKYKSVTLPSGCPWNQRHSLWIQGYILKTLSVFPPPLLA